MTQYSNADLAIRNAIAQLKYRGVEVDAGRWQGVPTEGKPDLLTREILNLNLEFSIPHSEQEAAIVIRPNLPWAENHFQERVSRDPSNPGKEFLNWPWWKGQVRETDIHDPTDTTTREFKFTHTYQERFWPAQAGEDYYGIRHPDWAHRGIRYSYGDLDDVINLLHKEPNTRQAYFPIFFPEDTGAVHGGRIPCTLGYHFLLRGGALHCWYAIRSCDAVRHFRDDLYLAARLVQWVIAELVEKELRSDLDQVWVDTNPGTLFFTAYSFHVHMGDIHLL